MTEKLEEMTENFKEIEDKSEKEIKIIEMGKFALELEEKKEQSLLRQSGDMLTGFSVVAVVLSAVIPILLKYTEISNKIIFILLGFSLLLLIVSLLLLVSAHERKKYTEFHTIEEIYISMIDQPLSYFNQRTLLDLNEI